MRIEKETKVTVWEMFTTIDRDIYVFNGEGRLVKLYHTLTTIGKKGGIVKRFYTVIPSEGCRFVRNIY